MSAALVRTSTGRIILHVTCMIRDRKFRWHIAGIVREFKK